MCRGARHGVEHRDVLHDEQRDQGHVWPGWTRWKKHLSPTLQIDPNSPRKMGETVEVHWSTVENDEVKQDFHGYAESSYLEQERYNLYNLYNFWEESETGLAKKWQCFRWKIGDGSTGKLWYIMEMQFSSRSLWFTDETQCGVWPQISKGPILRLNKRAVALLNLRTNGASGE